MKKSRHYRPLIFCLIIISCAVRESPPGGPEDKTTPAITSVTPEGSSTMLQSDATFEISFSKAMNREKTEGAIFLSPVFWGYPTMKWSGRTLAIRPPESLKPNTTYILTIGAGAPDLHGNKLGKSQSFAFSTGAEIDSGAISGAIFSEEERRKDYDIWAYTIGDSTGLEFWNRIPDYVTQVDSSGAFSIEHLGKGRYLVIAIDDMNDDLFWDPAVESMGLPPAILQLRGEDQIRGIILRPIKRDTTLAIISKVTVLDRQKISFEFSQPVYKETTLNAEHYLIKCVNNDSVFSTGSVYSGEGNRLILEMDIQTPGREYRLIPRGMTSLWGVQFDTAGVRFTGTGAPDTVGAKLLSIFPPNGSANVYEDSVIELTFSERIMARQFAKAITVIADSTDTLNFMPIWIRPNLARLRFSSPMPRQQKIDIRLAPKDIFDASRNPMPDSALSYHFRLPPADSVGSVIASMEAYGGEKVWGILSQSGLRNDKYESRFDRQGKYHLESILPGSYRFEYFIDSDSNGYWSPGIVSPFRPAEWFSFLADTLIVRSRWTTDIGTVSMPFLGQ